jgi:hypothetical protein
MSLQHVIVHRKLVTKEEHEEAMVTLVRKLNSRLTGQVGEGHPLCRTGAAGLLLDTDLAICQPQGNLERFHAFQGYNHQYDVGKKERCTPYRVSPYEGSGPQADAGREAVLSLR